MSDWQLLCHKRYQRLPLNIEARTLVSRVMTHFVGGQTDCIFFTPARQWELMIAQLLSDTALVDFDHADSFIRELRRDFLFSCALWALSDFLNGLYRKVDLR